MLSVYSLSGVFFVLGDFFACLKKEERKGMDRGWVQSPFPAFSFFFFFTLTLSFFFFFVFVFVFVFVFAFAFSFSLAPKRGHLLPNGGVRCQMGAFAAKRGHLLFLWAQEVLQKKSHRRPLP